MGFLNNNNFIIKSSKTELHAHSGTYNSYNYLYSKCLKFLILWHIYLYRCSSTNFLMCKK